MPFNLHHLHNISYFLIHKIENDRLKDPLKIGGTYQ